MSGHNDEKEQNIFRIVANLTIACMVSGFIISGTYYFTNPIAIVNAKILEQKAMKSLVADADSFQPVEGKPGWFAAKKNGAVIAYIVPGETKGYGGTIKMMVAVSLQGTVIDYNILIANETPGLGDKASQDFFRDRLKGKTSENLVVVKDPSKKDNVQALTGATITSAAVTKGVREAVDAVVRFTAEGVR